MFEEKNAQLVSISTDNTFSLKAFALGLGSVTHPVISDFYPQGDISTKYGVMGQNGRSRRAAFIIDSEGIVQYSKVYEKGLPDNNEILDVLSKIK